MNNYGSAFKSASKEFKNDRAIVLAALKTSETAIMYASVELKDDEEIALTAVKKHDSNLNFVSSRLKNDGEVVFEALLQLLATDSDARLKKIATKFCEIKNS